MYASHTSQCDSLLSMLHSVLGEVKVKISKCQENTDFPRLFPDNLLSPFDFSPTIFEFLTYLGLKIFPNRWQRLKDVT